MASFGRWVLSCPVRFRLDRLSLGRLDGIRYELFCSVGLCQMRRAGQ